MDPFPHCLEERDVVSSFMSYRSVTDQYELATHTVKVRRSGMLSDVSVLWDMSNSSMVTGSAQSELVTNKLKIERLPSINCFNKVSGRTFDGQRHVRFGDSCL